MAKRKKVHVVEYNTSRPRSINSPWMGSKYLNLQTQVRRTAGNSRAQAYEACVLIQSSGRSEHRRSQDEREACARAAAPRRAIGLALKKMGAMMIRRRSAFRGA